MESAKLQIPTRHVDPLPRCGADGCGKAAKWRAEMVFPVDGGEPWRVETPALACKKCAPDLTLADLLPDRVWDRMVAQWTADGWPAPARAAAKIDLVPVGQVMDRQVVRAEARLSRWRERRTLAKMSEMWNRGS